jgi:hypothetical protein
MKFNLFDLFRKTKNDKPTEDEIQLYCQNPQCAYPLIKKGEVANVNGNLVHATQYCVEQYMCHEALRTMKPVSSNVLYIPHYEAKELAREGKVNFSKLEKGVRK